MGIKEINEQLSALQKQYDDAVESIRNTGLKDVFKEVFETSDIKGIAWTQSIPSFNDGEPCVFSVDEIFVTFEPLVENMTDWNGDYLEDYEDDEDNYGIWESNFYDFSGGYQDRRLKQGREMAIEITNFIYGNQDLMEKLFGSNSSILVTPEEIKVQEYYCGY